MPPKKKGTVKKAAPAAAEVMGQVPTSGKTGIYARTENSHAAVHTARDRYGLTTELMEALLVIIMHRFYAVQRDSILGFAVNNSGTNWNTEGQENSLVTELNDRKRIHKQLYDIIAHAQQKYSGQKPHPTFIPLDAVLGVRQPDEDNQNVMLSLLLGAALASSYSDRVNFFRSQFSKKYSALLPQFEALLGVAQFLGLDFSFFGQGNKMAGLLLIERPAAGKTVDQIDAHISIEPSYYQQKAEAAGKARRVSGWHFSNHHKPVGAGGSVKEYRQFYTNYGRKMPEELAIAESVRTATSTAPHPTTPLRRARINALAKSASGNSVNSTKHNSPLRNPIPVAPLASENTNSDVLFRFEISIDSADKHYIITIYNNAGISYRKKSSNKSKDIKDLFHNNPYLELMIDAIIHVIKTRYSDHEMTPEILTLLEFADLQNKLNELYKDYDRFEAEHKVIRDKFYVQDKLFRDAAKEYLDMDTIIRRTTVEVTLLITKVLSAKPSEKKQLQREHAAKDKIISTLLQKATSLDTIKTQTAEEMRRLQALDLQYIARLDKIDKELDPLEQQVENKKREILSKRVDELISSHGIEYVRHLILASMAAENNALGAAPLLLGTRPAAAAENNALNAAPLLLGPRPVPAAAAENNALGAAPLLSGPRRLQHPTNNSSNNNSSKGGVRKTRRRSS